MPKKTATARGAAQRNKPRAHKSVELVRQHSEKKERVTENTIAPVSSSARSASDSQSPVSSVDSTTAKATSVSKETLSSKDGSPDGVSSSAPKASASARLAARRQAAQKSQRTSVNMISAEH